MEYETIREYDFYTQKKCVKALSKMDNKLLHTYIIYILLYLLRMAGRHHRHRY